MDFCGQNLIVLKVVWIRLNDALWLVLLENNLIVVLRQ